jgi:hypothetical protein
MRMKAVQIGIAAGFMDFHDPKQEYEQGFLLSIVQNGSRVGNANRF